MELICICCPLGCRINIEKTAEGYDVKGNSCPRGKQYAIAEMTAPTRMVTTSIIVEGGNEKMLSLKTDKPIAKSLIFDALNTLKGLKAVAPIKEGDVIKADVLGSGVNFIATRSVEKAE